MAQSKATTNIAGDEGRFAPIFLFQKLFYTWWKNRRRQDEWTFAWWLPLALQWFMKTYEGSLYRKSCMFGRLGALKFQFRETHNSQENYQMLLVPSLYCGVSLKLISFFCLIPFNPHLMWQIRFHFSLLYTKLTVSTFTVWILVKIIHE